MNNRNRRALEAVFETPVRPDIQWADIEKLFKALGAGISEGRGSRGRLRLNDRRAVFHRPHPGPNADKGAVVAVREFLKSADIQP